MPEGTDNIKGLEPSLPTDNAPAGEGAAELRQLKAVLKNCLGEVDGPIYNADGEKPSAADFTALFRALSYLIDDSTGQIVPQMPYKGMVIMYYGDVRDLPPGWVFCDGRNGTPRLVGRFPLGWQGSFGTVPLYDGQANGGALPEDWTVDAGGAHTHGLSISDHELTSANLPPHSHTMFASGEKTGDGTEIGAFQSVAAQMGAGPDADKRYRMEAATVPSTPPNVGVTGVGNQTAQPVSHSGSTASAGSHTHTISNAQLPPWGCVFFLMYVGTS